MMTGNHQVSHVYGIIGLGRFGSALAENLAANGCEVLAIDSSETKIRNIQDKVSQALVAQELDKQTLMEAGIQNCGTVIVCIGENVEGSILTTLNVIEMEVPRVIAKAVSVEHGRVLQKLGAEVVYPERDRAIRLASALIRPRALDYIDLSVEYSICEVRLSAKLDNKTILEADLRRNFGLNIVAIVRGQETIVEISPDLRLKKDDYLAVVGTKESMTKFEKFIAS